MLNCICNIKQIYKLCPGSFDYNCFDIFYKVENMFLVIL